MDYFNVLAIMLFYTAICQSSGCKDTLNFCSDLSDMCYNSDVLALCPATCNKCSGIPQTAAPQVSGQCGKPDIQGITRVIAGKTAIRGSWPWQILLMLSGQAMCGGTIIAPEWIVTAAHCVYGREWSGQFSVKVGEHDRYVNEGSEATYQVQRVYRHQRYNPNRLNNDIALLKLNRPIAFGKYVKPICLPKKNVPVGTTCFITGWGKIRHPGGMTRTLQQAILPVVGNTECYEKNRHRIPIPITEAMICGGDAGVTRRSGCHGDSGGPYVCKVNGVWELHGAVSHGSPVCSSSETYTVFARVFHFVDWIKNTLRR